MYICPASRPQANQLPPLQSATSPEIGYYPPRSATQQLNAVFGRDTTSPAASKPQNIPLTRGQVPQFRKCLNVADLNPKVNLQPPFRRANPEGGFISVSLVLDHL